MTATDTNTVQYVTASCMFCCETSVVELTVEEATAIAAGAFIQDAAASRPAPERELIRSGIHPDCWTANFG